MALSPEDLRDPLGLLDAAVLWPGQSLDTVDARLQAYLDEAVTKTAAFTDTTDQVEAQKQWAYFRAYDAVYQRLVSLPSTVAFQDEGSGSYLVTQMQLMKERRDDARAAFEELEDALDAVVDELDFTTLRSFRD